VIVSEPTANADVEQVATSAPPTALNGTAAHPDMGLADPSATNPTVPPPSVGDTVAVKVTGVADVAGSSTT